MTRASQVMLVIKIPPACAGDIRVAGCKPRTQGISRETVQALTSREKSKTVLNEDVTQGC